MSGSIHLLNGSTVDPAAVATTATFLGRAFGRPVAVAPYQPDLERVFDASRGQYHSSALLKQMLDRLGDHGSAEDKLVALVDVDLFIPVLTFVFGEAQLSGRCAVVSTFRLQNAFYGIPADTAMLAQRVEKEIVHEVGHLFGLVHCRAFECVMRSSTYVEEIDLKSAGLCGDCAALVKNDHG